METKRLTRILYALTLIVCLTSCQDPSESLGMAIPADSNLPAQSIVDSAIAAMGGEILDHAEVSFRFRVRDYIYRNDRGQFEHTRIYVDTAGQRLVDVYTNAGLTRTIDGEPVHLDSTWQARYSNSVNSVMYFAFLPYRLNDPAVIKNYIGTVEIKDNEYHEILIQFRKEGGGKDYEDNFLYWFDTDTYVLDYFAYDYVTDGGGVRFREAFNRRIVNGLTIQDYINYKPVSDTVVLSNILDAYLAGALEELSRIELEDVQVVRFEE